MRSSQEIFFRTSMNDIFNLQMRQLETQNKVNTGKEILAPSDAPDFAVTVLDSVHLMAQVTQYGYNLEAAQNWMTASESAMSNILDLIDRASVMAEQMATGTYQPLEHQATAGEVAEIINTIVTLANTKAGDSYLFAGTRAEAPPITAAVMAEDVSSLFSDSIAGTGTQASAITGGGLVRLQLAGLTIGDDIASPPGVFTNTLGDNLLGVGFFNTFLTIQESNSIQTDILRSVNGVPVADPRVSDRVGEELIWDADVNGGGDVQTYRTSAVITLGAGGPPFEIAVDGLSQGVVGSAAELVTTLNQANDPRFMAQLQSDGTVRIISKGIGSFSVTDLQNTTCDQEITMDELVSDLNDGVRAQGVLHFDGALDPFNPPADSVITLGDQTWTWGEILAAETTPPANTAVAYAQVLSNWINSNSDGFRASAVVDGAQASVLVSAGSPGKAGNVALTSDYANILDPGQLYGGMDGSDTATTGHLYAQGDSGLRLDTTLRVTVLEVDGGDVSLRVRWYDDDGTLHSEDVTLSGSGDGNSVAIPGLGDMEIFRDSLDFTAGAVFDIQLGHYQGNREDLEVNFSEYTRMGYNWNAEDILGGHSTVNLLGETADARNNTGTGTLNLSGAYRGILSRDFNLDVMEGGQPPSPPNNQVTLRVSFTDDNGVPQQEEIVLTGAGLSNRVEIPGSDGVYVHLDNGTYDLGDSFYYSIEKRPIAVLDTLTEWQYQLESGDQEAAQAQSQLVLQALQEAREIILDSVSEAGTRMERIEVRQIILEDRELFAADQLTQFQEVDITQALQDLQMQQTAYQASLKVVSMVSQLSLVNLF